MDAVVVEKVWEFRRAAGKGWIIIVISPQQADLVSDKMGDISAWFEDATDD